MRDLIYRYFYVKGDTLTPFKNSITVSLLNIIMSLILSNFFGVYGIVLGTMITSYISLLMIIIKFIKKYGFKYNKRSFFAENSKVLIITMVSILIVGYIKKYLAVQSEVLNIMFYVPISLFIFITLLYLLKSKVFRINF